MKFLIFGDVVGRPGRAAINRALPLLKAEYQPDSIIINIENIAHGAGLSPKTIDEALTWQADVYTTGDHAWDNKQGVELLANPDLPIIRPANYPAGVPGRGYHIFTKARHKVAVINLQGQVFFRNHPLNPFHALDALLQQPDILSADIILVDFQAEATSEKRALGWHADGRLTALWGTHTHVPTADAQIMPAGAGYVTDIGMNGNYLSNIGVDRSSSLQRFLTQLPRDFTFDDIGPLEVGALFLEADQALPTGGPSTKKATGIELIRRLL